MNLAQVKRLKVGDKFSKPSAQPNRDFGFRNYTVVLIGDTYIVVKDQHSCRIMIDFRPKFWKQGNKRWMKYAERIEPTKAADTL